MKFSILTLMLAAGLFATACGDAPAEDGKGALVEPDLEGGKSDVIDRVKVLGRLVAGEPVTGAFTKDLEFQAYTFDVFNAGPVTLEITQKGSTRKLDTSMFVYGPQKNGRFADDKLAKDDDSGWGALSRLRDLSLEPGTYLVVLGTATGDGRGNYRLVLDCADSVCLQDTGDVDLDACPLEVEEWLTECIEETVADLDTSARDAWEICRDNLDVLDTFESLCFEDAFRRAPAWCSAGDEAFSEKLLPACTDLIDGRLAPTESDIALTAAPVSDEMDEQVEVGAEVCEDFCSIFASAFFYTTQDGLPPTASEAVNAVIAGGLDDHGMWINEGEVAAAELSSDLGFREMGGFIAAAQAHTRSELFFVGRASFSSTPFPSVDAHTQAWVMVFPETGWFVVLEITDFTE
jgi:hypothetical protein